VRCRLDADEELVGDRECLRDTGGESLWNSVHTLRGGSLLAKWTVPSSVFRYWVGSSGRGATSSIGLSSSSWGFFTRGGSWYDSIEEYCRQWVFQGIGVGGCIVGRSKSG